MFFFLAIWAIIFGCSNGKLLCALLVGWVVRWTWIFMLNVAYINNYFCLREEVLYISAPKVFDKIHWLNTLPVKWGELRFFKWPDIITTVKLVLLPNFIPVIISFFLSLLIILWFSVSLYARSACWASKEGMYLNLNLILTLVSKLIYWFAYLCLFTGFYFFQEQMLAEANKVLIKMVYEHQCLFLKIKRVFWGPIMSGFFYKMYLHIIDHSSI